MTSERAQNFQREAELHEQDAVAIAEEAAWVGRRADLAVSIAELKDKEAAIEPDESKASRLRFEGETSRREAGTLEQVARTLIAERDRALAQAETARVLARGP